MEKYTKEQLEITLDELFEQNANSIADNEKYDWRFEVSCYIPRLPSFLRKKENECGRCGKIYALKQGDLVYSKSGLIYNLLNKGISAEVEFYCDDCIKESGGKKGQLRYKKDGATDWDTIELDDETIDQLLHDDEQDNSGDDK